MTENVNVTTQTSQGTNSSTLIEFPGINRNRPAWRKELSERFREIQQRRAREAALEAEVDLRLQGELEASEAFAESEATKQLGLVPPPDEPELNPLVKKALRRIERAHAHGTQPVVSGGRSQAAAAAARVVEERVEEEAVSLPALVKPAAEKKEKAEPVERPAGEPARTSGLLVIQAKTTGEMRTTPTVEATAAAVSVPAPPLPKAQPAPAKPAPNKSTATAEAASAPEAPASRQPRKISGVIDDHWLERRGADPLPKVTAAEHGYDDRAPRTKRLAAATLDLLAVAFLCAPFAAVIELTIGDWSEPRVMGSMVGIVAVVMFLYHTCSVALASRTLGMKLLGLHAVDANKASVPTTWQCARRALFYLLSLATFGLGLLYSLFDAEGRTVHDLLSGTVVVKE